MRAASDHLDLLSAVWRTWRGRGLLRRGAYEVAKRTGRLQAAEDRWLASVPPPLGPLRPVGLVRPAAVTTAGADIAVGERAGSICLYGGLDVETTVPPDWHRHPLTAHRFAADVHWSALSDSQPDAGDIKDVWELSRLGWLQPMVRRWAATGDDADAEAVWAVIEDWQARNPPYAGPNWMCGQETALRTTTVMMVADALSSSAATTDRRHLLVARMVQDAVGRVAPTLGYALSQRNNHASSEAGFLWTATVLAPWLPGAAPLRERAARALSEVAADQFAVDGSYAQHSPTYHRVALHVLLWCLAVARSTGVAPPAGVESAASRSVGHLRSLIAPDSGGQVPNLGGNDGALVIGLAPVPIDDFRPVVAHAAAATGQPSGFGPGPWNEEAAWFGLHPVDPAPVRSEPAGSAPVAPTPASAPAPHAPAVGHVAVNTHPLTRGRAHAILRAGPSSHRPAHADQLHLDVWLDGAPVGMDAGSYRYTAPAPWGNALAGEEVHNLPRCPGVPQAVRSGRFFWRRWSEASVERSGSDRGAAFVLARLTLADATTLRRLVMVVDGRVVVVDRSTAEGTEVRWNLPAEVDVSGDGAGPTSVEGRGWRALVAGGPSRVLPRSDQEPASGWHAPSYAEREPSTALIARPDGDGPLVTVFATDDQADGLEGLARAAAACDGATVTAALVCAGRGPSDQ